MLPIPRSLDDVTPEWLTGAFRDAGVLRDRHVLEAASVRIGQKYGFTGVVGRACLRYDDARPDLPSSVVVKLPMALDEAASGFRRAQERDPEKMRRHYERCAREVHAYREIGAASFLPRLYHSGVSDVSRRVVLVLEDLAGYRQGDILESCSVEDVAHVIDELAPFHARYWGGRAPAVGFESTRMGPAAHQERYAHLLEHFLRRHPDALDPEVLWLATRLASRLGWITEKLNQGPRTLIHGDLHLDNLLFDPHGHDVTILDWQIASVGPPASDVALLLYSSLEVDERRAAEADLLARYAALLSEHGVSNYSPADLRADCDLALLLILSGTIGGLTTINPSEMTVRELALHESALTTESRLVSALLDHQVERLLH